MRPVGGCAHWLSSKRYSTQTKRPTVVVWGGRRGGRLGWSSISRPPQTTTLLPARSRDLALHLARGRGSPPLRFASTRGPPSSTNTSQMFMARPDGEGGAGASGQQLAEERVQECEGTVQIARSDRSGVSSD